jgi:hypothetical protein
MSSASDRLKEILGVIQGTFGVDWLLWKSGKSPRGGQRSEKPHPLAVAWVEATDLLAHLESGQTLPNGYRPRIAFLDKLASDLVVAQNIPNFAKAVTPQRLKLEFEQAYFEVYVGALHHSAGQQVEFLPPSGKTRMPDLRVIHEQQEIFLECTRKDPLKSEREDDSGARHSLGDGILALQKELASSLEIIAVILGTLDSRHVETALRDIRLAIEKGGRGTLFRPVDSVGVIVRELTRIDLPQVAGVGVVLPDGIMSPDPNKRLALAEGTYDLDERGQPYLAGEKRVSVYVIDSHRMSSVVDSFMRKRGQIPKDSSGVVYVSVDVTQVAEGDVDLYMQMAQQAILAALTTPPGNPQIGAVVLVTTPVPVPVSDGQGNVRRVVGRRFFLVRNPNSPLPNGFPFPGAAPPQAAAGNPKS